jgi:hypothetical protein
MKDLEFLINEARKYRTENTLTEEEKNIQIRSFAFGNTNLENGAITKADIDRAVDSLKAETGVRTTRT